MDEEEAFEEFKQDFADFSEIKDVAKQKDSDGEVYELTEFGVRYILEMYERVKYQGLSIEEVEEVMDISPSDDHSEFRVLMAMGEITGIFDKYDEINELAQMLDEVEANVLYGESDE